VDVPWFYDNFSASVIYGLESYGFCEEGIALDFIQSGTPTCHSPVTGTTFIFVGDPN
jgi:hypothetical protein